MILIIGLLSVSPVVVVRFIQHVLKDENENNT